MHAYAQRASVYWSHTGYNDGETMIIEPKLICVGAIMGAYGVRGEARIKSFCADPAAIDSYNPLTTKDASQNFTIKITRPVKGGFAAKIAGFKHKEQIDALKGTTLFVARHVLPNLKDDEFYHTDLVGLKVLDTSGATIGTVHSLQDHGAGDLLEIKAAMSNESFFIPFTKANVPTIDMTLGQMIIDPPHGLLPETKKR